MSLLLLLACHDAPAKGDCTGDSAVPDEPGVWEDPIVGGGTLDLGINDPELTEAVRAGDTLVLAGQGQTEDGGMWTYSLADPDAPLLLGHTPDVRHIQRACVDGDDAWGMTREGLLLALSLGADGPTVRRTQAVGALGAGIACGGGRVVWGNGLDGGGWALRDGDWIGPITPITSEVQDVLIEGDRLWVLAYGSLTAWDFEGAGLVQRGQVALDGTCLDLAPGDDWIAVACGSGGVALVDRGDGEPTLRGRWDGWASARAVAVQGDDVWVAAWNDLLLLDATDPTAPWMRAAEPAVSAVMAVAAGDDCRVYAADWNHPFVATDTDARAPEVRLGSRYVQAEDSVAVWNEGPEPLWLGEPSQGTVPAGPVAPGESVAWTIPAGATGTATLATDDPDEPTLTVTIGGIEGLLVGSAAPYFQEPDLHGNLWDLSMLHGEVVFLGLFADG